MNTVFQSYALFPHLDVFENVAFGLRRKKVDKGDIDERVKETLRARRPPGLREAQAVASSRAASSSGSRWPARW